MRVKLPRYTYDAITCTLDWFERGRYSLEMLPSELVERYRKLTGKGVVETLHDLIELGQLALIYLLKRGKQ